MHYIWLVRKRYAQNTNKSKMDLRGRHVSCARQEYFLEEGDKMLVKYVHWMTDFIVTMIVLIRLVHGLESIVVIVSPKSNGSL